MVFSCQSKADTNTFELSGCALIKQTSIIGTTSGNVIESIRIEAKAYPENKGTEDTARLVYGIYSDAYDEVQIFRDDIIVELPEDYFRMMSELKEDTHSFWNRLRPTKIGKNTFEITVDGRNREGGRERTTKEFEFWVEA